MTETKGKESTDKLLKTLRDWQGIERHSIESTSIIIEKTQNPLIREFMEIIRTDSMQHHRVQQFIIDSLTKAPVTLTHEDLAQIWEEIENHARVESKTIEMAEDCKEECKYIVQRSLLEYLIADEKKHDLILKELEVFKKKMASLG
jgi:rubrerythrin